MSNVLHKLTKEFLQRVNRHEYPEDENWIHGPDISAVKNVDPVYWVIEEDNTVREATQEEKDAIDLARLPELKAAKIEEFKSRTREIETVGFEYPPNSGKRISMNTGSRINISQARNDKLSPLMPWNQNPPGTLSFRTVNNAGNVIISSADEMEDLYCVGLVAYMTIEQVEASLEGQAKAAETPAELNAVTDPR